MRRAATSMRTGRGETSLNPALQGVGGANAGGGRRSSQRGRGTFVEGSFVVTRRRVISTTSAYHNASCEFENK